MNMVKVQWCRFQQCMGWCTMLLVEGSSETGLFRHLSDYVFGVGNFELNASKNSEKVFCLIDNSIWTGIVKLSLLRTGYFSSSANELTISPKILHVNKRDFFEFSWLGSDQWIW